MGELVLVKCGGICEGKLDSGRQTPKILFVGHLPALARALDFHRQALTDEVVGIRYPGPVMKRAHNGSVAKESWETSQVS